MNWYRPSLPPLLAMLVLAMTACGCLEYRNVVVVRPDGSGQIEVTTVYLPETVKDLQLLAGTHADAQQALDNFICDEEQLRLEAKAFGEDVQFKRVDVISRDDGARGFTAVYTFTDVGKIKIGKLLLGRREKPTAAPFPQPEYTFALDKPPQQAATLTVKLAVPHQKAKTAPQLADGEALTRQLKTLRTVLKGFHGSFAVRVEGKVHETSARHYAAETGTITLLEVDADRLLADEGAATNVLTLGQDELPALAELNAPGLKLQDFTHPLTLRFE